MKNIYKIILFLGMASVLNAGFPNFSINETLCAVVGESTMNGAPVSIDMETCEKLDEFQQNPKKEKSYSDSCSYSDIIKMHKEIHSKFNYTGWSGSAKLISDKMQLGIDILTDIKKCNIDKVAKVNNKMKENQKNINDKIGGVEGSVNAALDSIKIIKDFLENSMDIYDCEYDCEKHKPLDSNMTLKDKLNGIREGSLSFSSIKSTGLYKICKGYKMGCLPKITEVIPIININIDGLKEKLREKEKQLNDYINNENKKLNTKISGLQRGIDDSIATFKGNGSSNLSKALKTLWDPYNALRSEATSCNSDELPELRLSLELPDVDMCNLSDFDSKEYLDSLGENARKAKEKLKKDLEAYKEQMIQFLIKNMAESILNSMNKAPAIRKLMKVQKMAICSMQALMLSVTDKESLLSSKKKFAECKDTPQKVETKMSGTGGGKWFSFYAGLAPAAVPSTFPTFGAGITLNLKEVGAAGEEFASCLLEGLGAGYKVAYSKCLKGDEMGLSIDFSKDLNFKILPKLRKVKKLKCIFDQEEDGKDTFDFIMKNLKDNFKLEEETKKKKEELSNIEKVKENQINNLKNLKNSFYSLNQEKVWGEYFFKSYKNQCLLKYLEKQKTVLSANMFIKLKKELEVFEKKCRSEIEAKLTKLIDEVPINVYGDIEMSLNQKNGKIFLLITQKDSKTFKIIYSTKTRFNNVLEVSKIVGERLAINISLKRIQDDMYSVKNIFMPKLIEFTGKEGIPNYLLFGGERRVSDEVTENYPLEYNGEPNPSLPTAVIPYYKFKIGKEKDKIKTIEQSIGELKEGHKKILRELRALEIKCSNLSKVKDTDLKGCYIFKKNKIQLIQLFKGGSR